MQSLKYVGLLLGVGLLGYGIFSASSPAESASADAAVVYVCRETKQLVQAPPQQVPAVNPNTGRATLYRAMYCADCRKWHAVPPPEAFPGNPLTYRCPKHHHQMTADGPINEK
jgi:hypothetical protein